MYISPAKRRGIVVGVDLKMTGNKSLGVSVCQKKGVWFLNGNEWDGEWSRV